MPPRSNRPSADSIPSSTGDAAASRKAIDRVRESDLNASISSWFGFWSSEKARRSATAMSSRCVSSMQAHVSAAITTPAAWSRAAMGSMTASNSAQRSRPFRNAVRNRSITTNPSAITRPSSCSAVARRIIVNRHEVPSVGHALHVLCVEHGNIIADAVANAAQHFLGMKSKTRHALMHRLRTAGSRAGGSGDARTADDSRSTLRYVLRLFP